MFSPTLQGDRQISIATNLVIDKCMQQQLPVLFIKKLCVLKHAR